MAVIMLQEFCKFREGHDAGHGDWTALYDVPDSYGFEVNVVNALHTKTVPGRKTDVLECPWLQKLHTFGLLNNSFRPAEEIRVCGAGCGYARIW